jgi:hypothetical protein
MPDSVGFSVEGQTATPRPRGGAAKGYNYSVAEDCIPGYTADLSGR